jgi:hypothetical protein
VSIAAASANRVVEGRLEHHIGFFDVVGVPYRPAFGGKLLVLINVAIHPVGA